MSITSEQDIAPEQPVAKAQVPASRTQDGRATGHQASVDGRREQLPAGYSRVVHGLAMLLTATVFPLIWVGGLVTTYDAGMAVPDWPGTYGYNMFAYPASTWIFGPFDLLVEHSHRLLGATAGVWAIGLVVSAYFLQPRRSFFVWSILLLLAIISQGLLGGYRVLLDARTLAMIHGSFGPVVFAMATAAAVCSSRWWVRQNGAVLTPALRQAQDRSLTLENWRSVPAGASFTSSQQNSAAGSEQTRSGVATLPAKCVPSVGVVGLATSLVVFSFLQIVMGAQLRHVTGNTPPGMFTGFVHLHLTLAALVLSLAIALAACTLRSRSVPAYIRWPSAMVLSLVCVQIALGVGTWVVNYALPWQEVNEFLAAYTIEAKGFAESMIVTAHQATGSLILSFATISSLRAAHSRAVGKRRIQTN